MNRRLLLCLMLIAAALLLGACDGIDVSTVNVDASVAQLRSAPFYIALQATVLKVQLPVLIAGIITLFAGWKLGRLGLALNGFILGGLAIYTALVINNLVADESLRLGLSVAGGIGIGLLAYFLYGLMALIIGGAIGMALMNGAWLQVAQNLPPPVLAFIITFVSALVMFVVFRLFLVAFSAVLGAVVLMLAVPFDTLWAIPVAAAGIAVQTGVALWIKDDIFKNLRGDLGAALGEAFGDLLGPFGTLRDHQRSAKEQPAREKSAPAAPEPRQSARASYQPPQPEYKPVQPAQPAPRPAQPQRPSYNNPPAQQDYRPAQSQQPAPRQDYRPSQPSQQPYNPPAQPSQASYNPPAQPAPRPVQPQQPYNPPAQPSQPAYNPPQNFPPAGSQQPGYDPAQYQRPPQSTPPTAPNVQPYSPPPTAFRPEDFQLTLPNGQSYPLTGTQMTVGRNLDNYIVINDPQISGVHLICSVQPEGVIVWDNNSTNGSTVNGVPLTGSYRLTPTDVVQMGAVTLRLTRRTLP